MLVDPQTAPPPIPLTDTGTPERVDTLTRYMAQLREYPPITREEEQRLVRNAFTVVRTRLPKARLVTAGLDRSGDDLRNLGPYADSPAFFAAIDALGD